MWAPARIRSRTISQNPSWAARNKAPVPVFLWWSIYYFNWFKIGKEFKIFTFRRCEGLAPCRSSSRQHSKCPAAAVIINGVVPSWIKEKHNKSAVLHVLSVIIQKRKLLSNGYISLLLYRPTFSRGSYIIIQRDRPFVFSHLLHLFFSSHFIRQGSLLIVGLSTHFNGVVRFFFIIYIIIYTLLTGTSYDFVFFPCSSHWKFPVIIPALIKKWILKIVLIFLWHASIAALSHELTSAPLSSTRWSTHCSRSIYYAAECVDKAHT